MSQVADARIFTRSWKAEGWVLLLYILMSISLQLLLCT
jgi:hypothetical protein